MGSCLQNDPFAHTWNTQRGSGTGIRALSRHQYHQRHYSCRGLSASFTTVCQKALVFFMLFFNLESSLIPCGHGDRSPQSLSETELAAVNFLSDFRQKRRCGDESGAHFPHAPPSPANGNYFVILYPDIPGCGLPGDWLMLLTLLKCSAIPFVCCQEHKETAHDFLHFIPEGVIATGKRCLGPAA